MLYMQLSLADTVYYIFVWIILNCLMRDKINSVFVIKLIAIFRMQAVLRCFKVVNIMTI